MILAWRGLLELICLVFIDFFGCLKRGSEIGLVDEF